MHLAPAPDWLCTLRAQGAREDSPSLSGADALLDLRSRGAASGAASGGPGAADWRSPLAAAASVELSGPLRPRSAPHGSADHAGGGAAPGADAAAARAPGLAAAASAPLARAGAAADGGAPSSAPSTGSPRGARKRRRKPDRPERADDGLAPRRAPPPPPGGLAPTWSAPAHLAPQHARAASPGPAGEWARPAKLPRRPPGNDDGVEGGGAPATADAMLPSAWALSTMPSALSARAAGGAGPRLQALALQGELRGSSEAPPPRLNPPLGRWGCVGTRGMPGGGACRSVAAAPPGAARVHGGPAFRARARSAGAGAPTAGAAAAPAPAPAAAASAGGTAGAAGEPSSAWSWGGDAGDGLLAPMHSAAAGGVCRGEDLALPPAFSAVRAPLPPPRATRGGADSAPAPLEGHAEGLHTLASTLALSQGSSALPPAAGLLWSGSAPAAAPWQHPGWAPHPAAGWPAGAPLDAVVPPQETARPAPAAGAAAFAAFAQQARARPAPRPYPHRHGRPCGAALAPGRRGCRGAVLQTWPVLGALSKGPPGAAVCCRGAAVRETAFMAI